MHAVELLYESGSEAPLDGAGVGVAPTGVGVAPTGVGVAFAPVGVGAGVAPIAVGVGVAPTAVGDPSGVGVGVEPEGGFAAPPLVAGNVALAPPPPLHPANATTMPNAKNAAGCANRRASRNASQKYSGAARRHETSGIRRK